MNKTVNINLAGTFFHIDENAFGKLQRYLDAIRKSLTDPQGNEEIMRDIEARIAELFTEKIENSSQVISLKELDEVISVMGQPEDYMVDDEIFEDAPLREAKASSSHKQLYRDIDNKFVSGVSSGLAHYFGMEAIWIRLIWVLLTIFSSGFFIIVYILFWILVPAAETTSEKLKMTGEAVNISNIEKKFKEGYTTVADKVKNVDYDKYGKKVKSSASGFFDTLGNIILTLLKVFGKFIGIILIIISLSTLLGLIVGLFTFGSMDLWGSGEIMDYIAMVDTTHTPIWLLSLLVLFAVGIPFFVLFILGLKLLINNLKSIGSSAKIILMVLWILSLIGLAVIGIRQATEKAYDGEYIVENTLSVRSGDTLRLAMRADKQYNYNVSRRGSLQLKYNEKEEQVIYSNDINLIIRSTRDSIASLVFEKQAEGSSFLKAKKRAQAIDYNYSFSNNTLLLDGFFTTDTKNNYRDQEITITLYLPEGTILYAEENTYSFHRNSSVFNILDEEQEGHYLEILEDNIRCLDCSENKSEWNEDSNSEGKAWQEEVNKDFDNTSNSRKKSDEGNRIIIDKNGVDINLKDEEDSIKIKVGN